MDLSKLVKKYQYDNGNFSHRSGRYAGQSLEQKVIVKELLDFGIELSEIQEALQALAKACQAKVQQEQEVEDRLGAILDSYTYLLTDLYPVINCKTEQMLVYRISNNKAKLLASKLPKTEELVDILMSYYPTEMSRLYSAVIEITPAKFKKDTKIEDSTRWLAIAMLDKLYIKEPMIIDEDIKPLTLSTNQELSLQKLPYVKNDSPKLNEHLQELLGRVTDSERLCALLWIAFNGHKSPYVVYLYGEGGEGKSSFTGMLRRQLGNDAVASFDNANQFSNFGMFGKALIILSENNNPRVLQKAEVKQLTGDSIVSIEAKGKDRFSGTLSGLLLVDSNVLPEIDGDSYELRRLRLFKFDKPKTQELWSKEMYEKALGENFNDFVNHCRICYEKLGKHWMVPPSPNQELEFQSLLDQAQLVISRELWSKMKRAGDLELDPTGEITESEFFKILHGVTNIKDLKKNFGDRNLFKYLRVHHGIVKENGKIKGLRQNEKQGAYFEPFED